ncbi:MAG: hypothetical protein AB1430_24585 [Pseudomonadota bacterium]
MLTPPLPSPAAEPGAELERALASVEQRLASLGEALNARDALAIETHAAELHRALADAVHRFAHAARAGGVPPGLRRRLANASGQVAAQRESLARATAALDRAIDVLLPRDAGGVYSAQGGADRGHHGGVVQA